MRRALRFVVVVVIVMAALGVRAAAHPEARPPVPPAPPTVTLDVVDADLKNLLRLVADVGQKNLVVGDDVVGRVTAHLRRVSWRDAFVVLLRTKELGYVEDGDVLFVAPQAKLDAEELAALDRRAAVAARAPRRTRVVAVNNGAAKDLAAVVAGLLGPRGSVTVDERTNTLIVRDVGASTAGAP